MQYRLGGWVEVKCNSDVLKVGGEEEERISDDSQDLILHYWIVILLGKEDGEKGLEYVQEKIKTSILDLCIRFEISRRYLNEIVR